ncbi:helix-turn-helix domain-containing protein [Halomonas sp. ATCH28]|uniref:Helix-turn-helix domain-containing protein n=1 Tax=Halomonas gemina TaxID=2945105 RepID=A0ABT0SW06_9GAMM|nr:helix-turn-helix transcriptional regulator [Halomonas gemina]MCL7938845.1 helix-turn-helix domain-containing protein [Halomonas gemina]
MGHEASRDSLATRILQLREAAGLTKADLARCIGVSDVTIGYWETGNIKQIGHERLLTLASAFGISVSELLDDPMLVKRDARIRVGNCPRCGIQESPVEQA